MKDKRNAERKVAFRGAHLGNLEANRVGLALILGILGIIIMEITVGTPSKSISFAVTFILAGIGYYAASRIFKKE